MYIHLSIHLGQAAGQPGGRAAGRPGGGLGRRAGLAPRLRETWMPGMPELPARSCRPRFSDTVISLQGPGGSGNANFYSSEAAVVKLSRACAQPHANIVLETGSMPGQQGGREGARSEGAQHHLPQAAPASFSFFRCPR